MKARLLICCLLALLTGKLFASSFTWNGSSSTNWATAANWTPSGVPSTNDTVTVVSATRSLLLDANRTVKRFTMTSGTFDLNSDTLTISTLSTFTAGTISNGVLKPQGTTVTFQGTLFNCTVNAVCGQVKFNGSKFNYASTFEQNGSSTGTGTGGNVFNADVTIKNSGTAYLSLSTAGADTFNAKATLIQTGSLWIQVAHGYPTIFNGNLEVNCTGANGIAFTSAGVGGATLASGKTITVGSTGFSSGTLLMRKFTQAGSTAQTLTLTGTSTISLDSTTFNGALTLSVPNFLSKYTKYYGSTSITKSSTTSNFSDGGNHFYADVTINNTSSNTASLRSAVVKGDLFDGNLICTTTTGQIQLAYFDTTDIKGNLSINHATKITFNNSSGSIRFTGSSNQSIAGSVAYAIGKIIVNKSSGTVTLNQPLTVDSILQLTSGIVFTTATNLITLKASGIVNGGNSSSFISGPIKKIGNTSFEFPVGKGDEFRTIEISAPSSITNSYTAEYFNEGQVLSDEIDTNISYLNSCNYWNLNRNSGTSDVYVSLSWGNSKCGISDTSEIKLANFQSTKWNGLDKGNVYLNSQGGKIQSLNPVSNYGYFSIANGSAGSNFAMVICNEGSVDVWAQSGFGQHGDCTVNNVYPTSVLYDASSSNGILFCNTYPQVKLKAKNISAGRWHGLAVLCDNTVASWGINNTHQLGNLSSNYGSSAWLAGFAVPVQNSNGVQLSGFIAVAAGQYGSLGLKSDGTVWYWGAVVGCLSSPTCTPTLGSGSGIPTVVHYANGQPLQNVVAIAAGGWHFLALLNDGTVVSWGRNNKGQLGTGTFNGSVTPVFVYQTSNVKLSGIKAISAGFEHSLALTATGSLYSWGSNQYGQVGNNSFVNCDYAKIVLSGPGSNTPITGVTSIACGSYHSLAVRSGNAYAWGDNNYGQIGSGSRPPYTYPVPNYAAMPGGSNLIYAVSGGENFSLAFSTDNKIYGWGDDTEFQLAYHPSTPNLFDCSSYANHCFTSTPIDISNNPISAICTPEVKCDRNVTYCYYDYQVITKENWNSTTLPDCYTPNNTDIYIENELLIHKGCSLTIATGINVYFGPNGHIVLEEGSGSGTNLYGGELIIEHGAKLTAAGECMWKGIEVRGNSSYASTDSRQGKITINPGGIIENAHTAVLLGKWNSNYYTTCGEPRPPFNTSPVILTGSGGVIHSDGAVLRNNAIDIRFAPYSKSNTSYIKNGNGNNIGFFGGSLRDPRYLLTNVMILNNPFFAAPNALQRASIGIYSWGTNGVLIDHNDFEQYESAVYSVDNRTKITYCNVANSTYGFKIENINGSIYNYSNITENSFVDVLYHIFIKGGKYDYIYNNKFNEINSGTQNNNYSGIYLNNSRNFKISDNKFTLLNYGIVTINSGIGGSNIGYTSIGNKFKRCWIGIQAQQINSGLQIKCNTFDNISSADYFLNWNLTPGTILNNQGLFSTTDEKQPIGDKFNQSPNYNELNSSVGNQQFIYFRHGNSAPDPVIPTPSGPILIDANSIAMSTFSNACEQYPPCNPDCSISRINLLQSKLDSINVVYFTFKSNLDNHSTDSLIYLLETSTAKDSISISNLLMAKSPLSDLVLIKAISKSSIITDSFLEAVLSLNSPLSDSTIQKLSLRSPQLNSAAYNRLMSIQSSNNPVVTLTSIERDRLYFNQSRELQINERLRYLMDVDSSSIALSFLKNYFNYENAQTVFSSYILSGQLDSALVWSDSIKNNFNIESDLLAMDDILIDLLQNNKSMFELDSAQESTIRQIANQFPLTLATINAQALLHMVYMDTFPDFIEGIEEGNRIKQSSIENKKIIDSDQVTLYPNPTGSILTIITEDLDWSVMNWDILDLASRKIRNGSTKLNGNSIILNLSDIPAGTYILLINNGLEKRLSKKLVILH